MLHKRRMHPTAYQQVSSSNSHRVCAKLLCLSSHSTSDQKSIESLTVRHLSAFASEGLRTLVLAKPTVPRERARAWLAEYTAACNALSERGRLLARAADRIEVGLCLVGASAVEDRLQEGVPRTITQLQDAGIKRWMLTGDKVGTAKNIATACNILPPEADTLEITTETFPVLAELKTSELLSISASSRSS